jgi:uncharacterized protein (TIGR03435 family)
MTALLIGFLNAPTLQAQSPPKPAFVVASIKSSKAEDFRRTGMKYLAGGRFVATNYPLQVLIAGAYNAPWNSPRLTGGPEWVRSERWDLEAKADSEAIPARMPAAEKRALMRLMLQRLLAERFRLTLRRQAQELPVYAMLVAKNGPKMQKAQIEEADCMSETAPDETPCHVIVGGQGYGLRGRAVDMSDLALAVESFADRPVVNKTGLTGLFSIETTGWIPLRLKSAAPGAKAENGADLESLPSLFNILSGIGLKLGPQKAPVEILVIERVEKPSPN